MTDDFVECPELAGKIIQRLRIYKDTGDGNEVQIDLTDGTSFNCCFSTKTNIDASMLRSGGGGTRDIAQVQSQIIAPVHRRLRVEHS